MKKTGYALAAFLFAASPLFAEDAMYRVIEIAGHADRWEASSASWKPLEKNAALTAGAKFRTGPDGAVDLVRDAYFENAMRVGPDSAVAFLNANPVRISLDSGVLYILKEEHRFLDVDAGRPSGIRILTRDFLAELREGGCVLESRGSVARLKVFSESIDVQRKTAEGYAGAVETIEEGFGFTLAGQKRLEYTDYLDWKSWYKKNDERKDRAG